MANLPELVAVGESQTLEFKRTFTEEVLETISAFANADGGIILIGVDDDGSVPGIDVGRKTLEDYANRIQVAIDPRLQPAMNVIAVTENHKHVVQLKIPQATSSAVSANGRFFKRVGKTNQRMSGEEIAQKLMSSMKLSWDSGIEEGSNIDDLDIDTINRFIALVEKSNRRPLPKESDPIVTLEKLELIVNRQPTRAALLLFGKRPQQYFQSAFIKLGRFKSEVNIVDDRELNGNIIAQVEEAMRWFRDQLQGEVVVEGTPNRRIDWEYPLDAVREAVANAVCHRDYKSDAHSQIRLYDTKLEFWNPGNLPPGISVDDLLKEHESRPRNKRIAEAFFQCGFIERWGTGTLRMSASLKDAGQPNPEFDNSQSSRFRVLFRKELSEEMLATLGLNDRQVAAFVYIRSGNKLTSQWYQEHFKISKRTASRELSELVANRILARHGKTGKGTFYTLP